MIDIVVTFNYDLFWKILVFMIGLRAFLDFWFGLLGLERYQFEDTYGKIEIRRALLTGLIFLVCFLV